MTLGSRAKYYEKFEYHLAEAEHPKKGYPTRTLNAVLAHLYYTLYKDAPQIEHR